jgi:hypothetical protein
VTADIVIVPAVASNAVIIVAAGILTPVMFLPTNYSLEICNAG